MLQRKRMGLSAMERHSLEKMSPSQFRSIPQHGLEDDEGFIQTTRHQQFLADLEAWVPGNLAQWRSEVLGQFRRGIAGLPRRRRLRPSITADEHDGTGVKDAFEAVKRFSKCLGLKWHDGVQVR